MKRDLQLDIRLDVVRIQGWQRDQGQPETGLHWHPPSPNLRSPTQAMLYPAVGLLEGTNLSVGRGTAHPFEWLGAPFVDGTALLKQLREAQLPGVRFEAALFTPESSRHRGVPCHGVRLKLTDPGVFRPVRTALTLATILRRLHPERWDRARLPRLIANRAVVAMLEEGASVEDMEHSWQDALRAFRRRRAQVLLYQPAGPEGRRVPQR